ncbi:MAG: hypothetical protein GY759_19170 [Chloroflexi bacterium]|nr:hypothetical protein [Chloroflexota bacterium]
MKYFGKRPAVVAQHMSVVQEIIRKQATPFMNFDTKQILLHKLNTHTHTAAWNRSL